jgi:hypothetical protein
MFLNFQLFSMVKLKWGNSYYKFKAYASKYYHKFKNKKVLLKKKHTYIERWEKKRVKLLGKTQMQRDPSDLNYECLFQRVYCFISQPSYIKTVHTPISHLAMSEFLQNRC